MRNSKNLQNKITKLEEKIIHLMSIRAALNSANSHLIGNASKIEIFIYKSLLNYTNSSDSKEDDLDKDETINLTKAAQFSSAIARARIHSN